MTEFTEIEALKVENDYLRSSVDVNLHLSRGRENNIKRLIEERDALKSELDAALEQNALLMKALNQAACPHTADQFLRDYQKEKSNDK